MDQGNWDVPRDDFRVQQDVRVRFNEIDGQNIVFSGNYLIYADIGVTEYFRALGEGQPGPYFHQYGTDIREVHSEIDYHAPARLDELITIAARVSHCPFRIKVGDSRRTPPIRVSPPKRSKKRAARGRPLKVFGRGCLKGKCDIALHN